MDASTARQLVVEEGCGEDGLVMEARMGDIPSEQRMANLEARLDEVTEAKERLERQVDAQTEELRVQRAAIARTQRALRNLSRPEEEAPTEPTLRDPNR